MTSTGNLAKKTSLFEFSQRLNCVKNREVIILYNSSSFQDLATAILIES